MARHFMPFILYAVAVVGFTSAGLGMLGVRPFAGLVRPALVLASAYSLVAIWCAGQGDLWVLGGVRPGTDRRGHDAIHHPNQSRIAFPARLGGGVRHDGLPVPALHHGAEDDVAD